MVRGNSTAVRLIMCEKVYGVPPQNPNGGTKYVTTKSKLVSFMDAHSIIKYSIISASKRVQTGIEM